MAPRWVYIAREGAVRPVRLVSELESRLPAHCCALGKALLASLTDDEVRGLLPRRLDSLTARAIACQADLLEALAGIRATGLAREREEVTEGLACFCGICLRNSVGQTRRAEHERSAWTT